MNTKVRTGSFWHRYLFWYVVATFFFVQSLQAQNEGAWDDQGIEKTTSKEPALADLFVNGEQRETVDFFLDQEQQPLLPSSLLRTALNRVAKPEIVAAAAAGDRLVTVQELQALGIDVVFDPNELKLSLTVTPSNMAPVDIGVNTVNYAANGDRVLKNANFGAVLGLSADLDPSYVTDSSGASFSHPFGLELTPALRAFDFVLEGDVGLEYEKDLTTTLYDARMIRDFPQLGARAAIGIVNTGAVAFQSSQELWGISFAKESTLPGAQQTTKRIIDEFVLERSADVTIEVNGHVLRRLHLSPGSYRLSDLPLSSGLNEVGVKIEEEGKDVRWARMGYPFDANILEKGEMDYAISLGMDRSDQDNPFGAGTLSFGVGQNIEIGGNAEAGYGIALGGLSALLASRIGTFGLSTGVSLPYAANLDPSYGAQIYWRFHKPSTRYVPRLGAAIEYRDPGFTAPREDIDLNPASDIPTWTLSAQLSENLPWGQSISAVGNCTITGESCSDSSFTLGLTIPIAHYISVYASGGVDWSDEDGATTRLSVLLSATMPDRRNINVRHDLVEGDDSIDMSMDIDDEGKRGIGFSGYGLTNLDADHSATVRGKMKTRYANYATSLRYYNSETDTYRTFDGSFSASTSLAYADGYFGMTNSLGNAIALVVPEPSIQKERIQFRVASGATTDVDQGRTGILSGLTPYQKVVTAVEMPESPPERRPNVSSIEFTPTYRSITLVKVGVASSITVEGRLLDEDREPRKNLSGYIVDESDSNTSFDGTFTDDDGIFQCYGLSAGQVAIRWNDGSVSSFTVPDGDPGAFFDIGDIKSNLPNKDGGSRE